MRARGWASSVFLLALSSCRTAAEEPDPPGPRAIHGSLASRYRARWTDDDEDHDLTEVLSLEVGDKEKDSVTGFVLAEGLADLDGKPRDDGASPFHSLADTYDGAVTGRLFHAYADLHDAWMFETLRIGRQMVVETPETAYFDGVRAETREHGDARTRFGAFGGVPVKIFASATAGDAMAGLFGESRPWKGGRLRLDWMHVEDEGLFGPRENDLYGLGASQSIGKSLRIDGEHTRFEDEPRDVRLRSSWYATESELVVQASWYRLLETQKDLAVPFDPFYATLFELHPYQQVGMLASRGFGEHFDLQAGFDLRRVDEEQDVGQFNHDFDRGFVTAGILGVLPAELDLSVTGEAWDGGTTDIRTLGADLSRRFGEAFDAAVGNYYSLFKYDLYQNRELDDVRTWYLKLRWKRTKSAAFDLRYEFEDDEQDEYHSLRLGATWRF